MEGRLIGSERLCVRGWDGLKGRLRGEGVRVRRRLRERLRGYTVVRGCVDIHLTRGHLIFPGVRGVTSSHTPRVIILPFFATF